jgi:hypothetical protein
MSDRKSGECLQLELERAETLQDVIAVCEQARDSECELNHTEKVLTEKLRRLRMERNKVETVKVKAEAKRTVLKGSDYHEVTCITFLLAALLSVLLPSSTFIFILISFYVF